MRDALAEMQEFIRGRSRGDLDEDRMLMLALVKEMEIVGEAANALSDETRELAPDVPWIDVIGMRHRLVHAYHDINLDILWQACQQDVPQLATAVRRMLKAFETQD
jgi:uncharacterized protein with HEPN domain